MCELMASVRSRLHVMWLLSAVACMVALACKVSAHEVEKNVFLKKKDQTPLKRASETVECEN